MFEMSYFAFHVLPKCSGGTVEKEEYYRVRRLTYRYWSKHFHTLIILPTIIENYKTDDITTLLGNYNTLRCYLKCFFYFFIIKIMKTLKLKQYGKVYTRRH